MRKPIHGFAALALSPALFLTLTSCGGAPLVLTEVPNGPSGQAFIARGASRSGCQVERERDRGLLLHCLEGELQVPTFQGPPTFAVRCIDRRLRDATLCQALVRRLLLAGDPDASP